MADVVRSVKQKIGNNTYTEELPLGAEAENVNLSSGLDLQTDYDGIVDILKVMNETLKYATGVGQLYKELIFLSTDWELDSTTGLYIYEVEDEDVAAGVLIAGYLDLDNQNRLSNGFIKSYEGGYTVYTTNQPTENITMSISMQKIVFDDDSLQEVIGPINISGMEWGYTE